MKSRETLIRLKRFHVEEKRRRLAQIETMIAEFQRMAADLDREIAAEEQKANIFDPAHFAYPTYAKAAAQRRDNLRRSAKDLEVQLDDAKAELGEAFEELKKVETLEDRERASERSADAVRDQSGSSRPPLHVA
jgi:flagellar protein FliJ